MKSISSKGKINDCCNNSIPKNMTWKIEVLIHYSIIYESINLPLDPEPEEILHLLQDFWQFLDIYEA